MSVEGVLEQAFVTEKVDTVVNWTRTGSFWPLSYDIDRFRRAAALRHHPAAEQGPAQHHRPLKEQAMRALLIAVILSGSPIAAGQDTLSTMQRLDAFRQLDANADGWLSRAEAEKRPEVRANFERADADRNGRLSFAEFETIALNRSDQPGRFRNPDRG
jgi:hypothetical protein